MDGARFIEQLRLKNILSFGSAGIELTLEPLNVLIGPNGSGKSNLIEALRLLRSASSGVATVIRQGGGIGEWLWKGGEENAVGELEATIRSEPSPDLHALHYWLHFTAVGPRFQILREGLTSPTSRSKNGRADYLERLSGTSVSLHLPLHARTGKRAWEAFDISPEESAMSRIREPRMYPELAYLGDQLSRIRAYQDFDVRRQGTLRQPQRLDLPEDELLEDASNLGLTLNHLEFIGKKQRIVEALRRFYQSATGFTVRIQGSTGQFYLYENWLPQPIAAPRLSDGTLRFLCLLAILLHPSPRHSSASKSRS